MVKYDIDSSGIDLAKLKGKQAQLAKAIIAYLEQVTIDAWRYSRHEAPRKTGTLRDSIQPDLTTLPQLYTRIFAAEKYAIYVHEGTKPHDIYPQYAKALRFKLNGQIIYAKHVKHPGTQPNPFFERAAETVRGDLPRLYKKIVGGAL